MASIKIFERWFGTREQPPTSGDTPPSEYVAGGTMTMGGKSYKLIRQRVDGSWIVQDVESGKYFKTQGAP